MKTKHKPSTDLPPPSPGSVLLTLDVSSSATGWATGKAGEDGRVAVLDFGLIRPPSGWDSIRKTDLMCMKLAYILKTHDVNEVLMEFQSYMTSGKRIQGLAVLGQAQGSVRAYLAITHKVFTVTERAWTKLNGKNARKDVRAEHVKTMIPAYAAKVEANPRFDPGYDVADALGLLLFWEGR